jgi:ATP-binding cassette subfamily B protein
MLLLAPGGLRPVRHRFSTLVAFTPTARTPPYQVVHDVLRARAPASAELLHRLAFRRLVKVMMTGTNTLWGLWLAFFREHFASLVSVIILMPALMFINWRYGLLLIALCIVFAVLIALVVGRSEQLQRTVERYYTDVAERTTDTLGNIALVQSFARIETEVSGMKKMGDEVLSAQIPVLSWWAVTTVITRTDHATMLSILRSASFYLHGLTRSAKS